MLERVFIVMYFIASTARVRKLSLSNSSYLTQIPTTGTEMKKLGPKRWIHPRCAENMSRSGACEMCGETLQPNSPRKKMNTISRFMTPRKKRVRNQIQCQLCGVRYCMSCYDKIKDTMKRVQSNDDRWIHLKCEERLMRRQISSRSQDREWSVRGVRVLT